MARSTQSKGFTIIEVLIVLAIAGLILLIVFLIVPSAKRSSRNYGRKHFVDVAAAQLDQYYQENGQTYPDTPAQMCNFISNYLKDANGGAMGACTASYSGSGDCVKVTGGLYVVCYHDRDTSPHSYLGPDDEISFQLGHWCNTDPAKFGENPAHPITSGGSMLDNEVRRYVVWTVLEQSGTYCIDNYPASN
ncbi:MAG TPA: type II secretion system protein [Nevskiaceae bacterium]|nr:type II secretion system protein [Nevskiaceae bacterium]